MTRIEAREQALRTLYAADATDDEPDVSGLGARATRLVQGTWTNRTEIDAVISRLASGWRIERMAPVDRNILRLGVYELGFTDLPVGVAVTEAIEMAKQYSTEKSAPFINGVLGSYATELGQRSEPLQEGNDP